MYATSSKNAVYESNSLSSQCEDTYSRMHMYTHTGAPHFSACTWTPPTAGLRGGAACTPYTEAGLYLCGPGATSGYTQQEKEN